MSPTHVPSPLHLPPPDPALKLSVLVIAYNVAPYIREALDSILMQAVDFPYEIVIGEDCSTDSTPAIIRQYAAAHPSTIRAFFRERNLGMNVNFVNTLQACRGRYIALLDGDDYWTSPSKLQKQVTFLDSHPHYSISFHNVSVVYEDDSRPPHPFHMAVPEHHHSREVPKATSTVEDLAPGNFIQTGSVVYRAGLVRCLPGWFVDMPTYDWPLHILNAQHGKVAYLDEILGAYRVRRGGIWSMNMSQYRRIEDIEAMIRAYAVINRHLHYKYDSSMRAIVAPLYAKAAEMLHREHRYRKAGSYARAHLNCLPLKERWRKRSLLKVMLRGVFPRTYDLLKRLKATLAR